MLFMLLNEIKKTIIKLYNKAEELTFLFKKSQSLDSSHFQDNKYKTSIKLYNVNSFE